MGSGISGSYFGTRGAEQSYSKLYSVASDMLKIDRQDLDIYSPKTGYFKNPTATDLLESVKDNKVLYRTKEADGDFMYVLNNNGRMIFNCFDWVRDSSTPKVHPTQKPVPLLERLIEIFTDKGDVVIDPCCGSGSTLLAAAQMGRRAYGFEIKKDFYKDAKEKVLSRIQLSMFGQIE
jgi:site-specific DNA-methyltransferase (adenine-specific)